MIKAIFKQSNILYIILLTISLIALPFHLMAQTDSLPENHKVLKSASELDYPPFAIVQPDGTAAGFSVDLLKAATEAVGLSVSFKVGPWNKLKQELAEGNLDVLPLVSYSEDRDKVYDFTSPYLRLNGTVFVRKGNTAIKNLSDLQGKEVLVMQGDTAHEYALKEKLSDTIIPKISYEDAFKLLASRKHDAIIVQQIVGLQTIKKLHISNVVAVEQKNVSSLKPMALKLEGFEQKFCFAVPEGHRQLLSLLNEGLAIISLNGTYNTLYEKWFAPILPKPHIPLSALIHNVLTILVPLLLCFTLFGLWYLKHQVAKRTHHLQLEILQRQSIENELANSNTKYAKAQNLGKVGNWEYNITSKKFWSSAEAKNIFGFNSDSISHSINEVESCIPERERVHQSLVDLIKQNKQYKLEYDIISRDTGEHKTILSLAELSRDELGKPQKILGVIQDITERKEAEMALRESGEKHRAILQTAMNGFWLTDKQGQIMEANERYCQMSGYSMEELLTMRISDLESIETARDVAVRIKKVLIQGHSRFESRHRRKDGNVYDVEVSVQYRPKDKGMFVCFIQDITQRKQAEKERNELQSQLQRAQKIEAIGTLAGGIAHDFNNILGAVIGYAEMVQEDCPVGSTIESDIAQVLKASHRAKELVKQILAFSRQTEAAKSQVQPEIIIHEIISILRPTLPTTITILQEIDKGCGYIHADPSQIHQILMNLCTNAFHAMERTGGNLTISLKKVDLTLEELVGESNIQSGQFLRLSIADTGTGIAPEIHKRIFDPYFTTKEVGKGSGMGLSIIHGIVKSYQGLITCYSKLDEGTVFHVYLPALCNEVLPGIQSAEQLQSGNEHILFIDDQDMLAEMGKSILERLGYRVTTRSNGVDALNTFENQPDAFDMVITDQTMPDMTGNDLALRILQIRPELPIILCTGFSNIVSEEMARVQGIKGFVMKPMTQNEIAELVRKVLDEAKLSNEADVLEYQR